MASFFGAALVRGVADHLAKRDGYAERDGYLPWLVVAEAELKGFAERVLQKLAIAVQA